MMNLERRTVGFQLRASSDDGSEFDGHASVYFTIDTYGSILGKGAFDETLAFFLQKGFIGGLNHNWSQPIGKPISATPDDKGLFCTARISDTTHGRDCKVLIKDGVISQLSIGFVVLGYEWLDTEEEVLAYWAENNYTPSAQDLQRARWGAVVYTKVRLYEYSPVTIPANDLCEITDVRSATPRQLDEAFATHLETVSDPELRAKLDALKERMKSDTPMTRAEIVTGLTTTISNSSHQRRAHLAHLAQYEADQLLSGLR